MSLQYVNFMGDAVNVEPPTAKKKAAAAAQQYHKGWRVVGYSPEQLREAQASHDRASPDRPFDQREWMLQHKPARVRSRPYELFSAAATCAEMATRAGWVGVRTVQVAKGGD